MSALGQKQTFRAINCDVCFTSKSDILRCERHVRFVPIADISHLRGRTFPSQARIAKNQGKIQEFCKTLAR
jgi:hypothetical protein